MADLASQAPSPTIGDGPSWRRAAGWLALLATFFYASYGFSNWLASQRRDVPFVVFDWERSIPFVAWTIFPYWTTNVFFALSLFLCRNRTELDAHARRLLTAQIVAVACFIAFPLRTSFPKPQIDGIPGFFFEALGTFDMPFNQAPSLHVAITTVLVALYVVVLPRWAAVAFVIWSLLVVGSVLTTFQHHFIDIPTGLLLGLPCIWMWPLEGGNRLATWQTTTDPQRRRLAGRYTAAAALLAAAAIAFGGAFLWLLWPAIALAAVAVAYLGFGPLLFAKSADGRVDWATRLLLLPYRLGADMNVRLWTRNDPPRIEIADGVWLGRFPRAAECRSVGAVIDMTCEFPRRAFDGEWHCVPMLDLVAPEAASLRQAADRIESARRHGPVLVCCALGYGRSAAALAVWMVLSGRATDPAAALARLKQARPRLAVNAEQVQAVTEAVGGR
ncbi:phosphatase PAP2/dual specificity phosphatase family protein [Reyranella sp.]|uniref:phosphatase PAP2/dual specificity phosphatase family protein n=1 Tax=Reyranella sp. TaxID=1929291 RepID=UPI003D14E721